MQASSIAEIGVIVNKTYFRVRNTITLRDYLVLQSTKNYFVDVYALDKLQRSFVSSDSRIYSLLSTPQEIVYLNSLNPLQVLYEASRNYVKSN